MFKADFEKAQRFQSIIACSSAWKIDGDDDGGEARMVRDLADEMLTLLIVILSERYVPGVGQVRALHISGTNVSSIRFVSVIRPHRRVEE